MEIGPADLSLTCAEAASLLHDAGLELRADDVAELHRRTEGWPTGLYLAALYLREGGSLPDAAVSFGGDDRLVSQYIESELLARISRRQRVFLTRTSVLDQMSGLLCAAVLETPESAATLAEMAGSNLLLVPLDRRGQWYRYHHLFRDMLLGELRRQEPSLIPVLHQRAAEWFERNGLLEEALEHAMSARDVDTAARLVEQRWLVAYRQARVTTVERWLRWLEERGGTGRYPMVAVLALFLSTQMGRPAEAERWADVVDRWPHRDTAQPGDRQAAAWAVLLRAMLCRRGVEQMHADADEAARSFAQEHIVESAPALFQGLAGFCPVTSKVATRSSRQCSAAERNRAHPKPSRSRWANDRCWRWRAGSGAALRSWPNKRALSCAGPSSRASSPAPCKPASPCTGETSRLRASTWLMRSDCGRP